MKLPNYENAIVPRAKIIEYLLSPTHFDGRSKAEFFTRYGFSVDRWWEELAAALLRHAAGHAIAKIEDSPFGARYIIEGGLSTPDGRVSVIRSVWFIETGEHIPPFCNRLPVPQEINMNEELSNIVLTTDLPEYSLERGDIGTVVLVHRGGEGYEVEFVALDGETVAVASLLASQVRPVSRGEIAHARRVQRVQ